MTQIERFRIGPRMSQAIRHGETIYLAGQVADDRTKDVSGQTAEVLKKIESLLAEAGTDKTMILMATVWLADMNDFEAMNRVWDCWVSEGAAPTRACIESRLAKPDIKVEVRVVAASLSAAA